MILVESDRACLAAAGTCRLSDAMERLALPRTVLTGFQCSASATSAIVGTAFTVRQVPKHHPATAAERLVRHSEVSAELAQAGDFVIVDAGGRLDIAGWGANHTIRCHQRGVSGVLVNGSTRDIDAIRRVGFPVFYRGISPVASRWDQETAELGGAVVVDGVQVRQGDILVADADGVVVIAPAQLSTVIEEIR